MRQPELWEPDGAAWNHKKKAAKQRKRQQPQEWKLISLRECPVGDSLRACETPVAAAEYWRLHVATHPYFNPECECVIVLHLNTRRRIRGHHFVSVGTLDTALVHPREIYRTAIVANASAIIVMHNHPSGDPTPSEADVRMTRDLFRAGQMLRIELLDHVIVGDTRHCSLRELGYLYT